MWAAKEHICPAEQRKEVAHTSTALWLVTEKGPVVGFNTFYWLAICMCSFVDATFFFPLFPFSFYFINKVLDINFSI